MKTKLILDITKSQQAQLNAVVTGRQGDKGTVTVNVFVVDGGVPYNLTGNTIYYEGLKPNNAYVRDTSGVKIINATQGNFEYTFRPETFGVAGIGKRSYFSIEQGGTIRASTQDFGLITLADAMTGNTMSGPYISELEELINLAQWLVDDINSRWTSINTQLTQLQNKLNTMDVVKRSGDTMTGDLSLNKASGNRYLAFTKGGTLQYYVGSQTQDKFHLRDQVNNTTVFEYDPVAKLFTMFSDTNLLKKTGDTMTGNLNFATASQIQNLSSTGQLVFGNSGIWINDTNGNFVPWQYRYSDKMFLVNAETNLMKKTDYSGKDGRVNLTLTADATNIDSNFGAIADRRGNTVTVRLAIMRNAGATGEIVTTLPANMRPTLTLVKWGIAEDGSPLKYQIHTDGTIRFYTTGKGLRIVETFVAD
ncbi:TPA: BppU family phage baseplate upper protein [Bacillus cereus]|nr:BppU family phage baseplate upper protein [Bacillus cereus]